MKTIQTFVMLLLLYISGAHAQNAKEAIQNTKQIVEGKKQLERDIKELKALKIKLAAFDKSFDNRIVRDLNTQKQEIMVDMVREVKQSEAKAKNARMEITQSSAEIRTDRREIRRDQHDSKRGRYDRRDDQRDLARDKVNMLDDQRDRRDDIRDFEEQIARAERQALIVKKLKTFSFSFDSETIDRSFASKKLMHEFIASLHEDILATKRELAEDNTERHEDRREHNDDRNERNEYARRRAR